MELDLRFSDVEVTAWGSPGLMKRMLGHIEFGTARKACGLPGDGGCTQHGDGGL